jgi:hypothetical protein
MQRDGNLAAKAQLEAEVARSLDWVNDGCPPHPTLGAYTQPDGSVSFRLMEQQSIGVITWTIPEGYDGH